MANGEYLPSREETLTEADIEEVARLWQKATAALGVASVDPNISAIFRDQNTDRLLGVPPAVDEQPLNMLTMLQALERTDFKGNDYRSIQANVGFGSSLGSWAMGEIAERTIVSTLSDSTKKIITNKVQAINDKLAAALSSSTPPKVVYKSLRRVNELVRPYTHGMYGPQRSGE